MATLVFGTIGRAVGGPIGGLVGTILGSTLDRGLFGGGKAHEGARLGDLAVQSSAYGEPIPRHYGRVRVAGNLVWSPGIRETRQHSGGGKHGTATNSYSYSASFAIVLAGRPIDNIGRIWADGKLLRDADGAKIYPAIIRTYLGDEQQPVDPLIAAAEGIDAAPAYRGRAYVVFEDLPLADYGNRIPNLTFEVIADAGEGVGLDVILRDIAVATGIPVIVAGGYPSIGGFGALGTSARETLAQLDEIAALALADDGAALIVTTGPPTTGLSIDYIDLGSSAAGPSRVLDDTRAAAASIPDTLTVGYIDPARDYQAGLQRAVRRTPVLRNELIGLDAVLEATVAKRLAGSILRRRISARTTATISLPWRHAGIVVGGPVTLGGGEMWRVRRKTIVGPLVELAVERVAGDAGTAAVADPGRVTTPDDRPQGPTRLHVLDLPPLAGALPTTPRLWLAAAGTGRWTRAEIVASVDNGDSYASVATVDRLCIMGESVTALPVGSSDRWDRSSTVEVDLVDPSMWLDGRSEVAVLAGANVALVGDEIIQFAVATAVAPGRFRLSTLLRGRRGTEAAIAGHRVGNRFVMLDAAGLTSFDPPGEAIGAAMIFKALGPGDDAALAMPVPIAIAATALRPLSPVFLRVVNAATGGLDVTWTRRSRSGFAWIDGIDAPLAEDSERYRITVSHNGWTVRETIVAARAWHYDGGLLAADGGGSGATFVFAVAQLSATAGIGFAAARSLIL